MINYGDLWKLSFAYTEEHQSFAGIQLSVLSLFLINISFHLFIYGEGSPSTQMSVFKGPSHKIKLKLNYKININV